MSALPSIPDNPEQCRQLLLDLLRRNDELRQQAQNAQRQAEGAQQRAVDAEKQADDRQRRVDELQRVLGETAANYKELQQEHAEVLETLALLRRYVFGPRRERFLDDPNQGHLFELKDIPIEPAATVPESASSPERPKAASPKRRTSFDRLPHVRIEHDLPEEEKTCTCCGGQKQRIGEDLSRELEFIPAKLEVKKQTWCLRC